MARQPLLSSIFPCRPCWNKQVPYYALCHRMEEFGSPSSPHASFFPLIRPTPPGDSNAGAEHARFAVALFPLYRPVKVVPAPETPLRSVSSQSKTFHCARIRLDFGRCVQRAQRRKRRDARKVALSANSKLQCHIFKSLKQSLHVSSKVARKTLR